MATETLSSRSLAQARLVDLPGNPEGERQLSWLELDAGAPFHVQRVYWLHTLAEGEERGNHAHRSTQQLLVAASGAFLVRLDDGRGTREFLLDDPTRALWLQPGLWRVIHVRAPGSVLLVLASSHFDEADYIRDYDEFLNWAGAPAQAFP
jgi:hypothetical protein